MDCVFCKIVAGNIPSRKIYEDEYTLAFLDIANDVDGHTVVIPKMHVNNILDCDNDTLIYLVNTIQLISTHYVNNCGYQGVNLLNSSGIAAQQSVSHFHIHIIPRQNDDGIDAWPIFKGCNLTADEMLQKLRMPDKRCIE